MSRAITHEVRRDHEDTKEKAMTSVVQPQNKKAALVHLGVAAVFLIGIACYASSLNVPALRTVMEYASVPVAAVMFFAAVAQAVRSRNRGIWIAWSIVWIVLGTWLIWMSALGWLMVDLQGPPA